MPPHTPCHQHHGHFRFTGAPPTELGNMTALTSNFYLNSNSLSSTIPTEFGRILQTLTGRFKLQSNQVPCRGGGA